VADGQQEPAGGGGGRREAATRVLRRANPVRAAQTAGRSTRAWARRPSGRLALPAALAAVVLAGAGAAGAYLVPRALRAGPSASAAPALPPGAPAPLPSLSLAPPPAPSLGPIPPAGTSAASGPAGPRPADALAGWARQVGTRAGIPVVAAQAYGYAELVVARTTPGCHLTWTTLAAIGKVESNHGSAGGAVLAEDGSVQPAIRGLPLDGKGGRQLVRDTDGGALDGDVTYDRAVGPMQFIPSTWRATGVDADNNGVADPNDVDDAALTAAVYLCQGGRDLSRADAWWGAILAYNAVRPYAQQVFEAADEYGRRSRA
jgi:Transglycosylase SLT domain